MLRRWRARRGARRLCESFLTLGLPSWLLMDVGVGGLGGLGVVVMNWLGGNDSTAVMDEALGNGPSGKWLWERIEDELRKGGACWYSSRAALVFQA